MQLWVEREIMIGDDASRREFHRAAQAGVEVFGAAVQDRRRNMGKENITGKQVAAEEKIEASAEESAMALRMSGQMNHAEAAPEGQLHVRLQGLVDGHRPVAEQRAAASFQRSTDAARAAVGKGSIDMRLFCGMGVDEGTAELLNVSQVAGVIKVSVRQENCPNIGPAESDRLERAFQAGHLAGKSGVHQHRFVVRDIVQEMKVTHESTNRVNPIVWVGQIERRLHPF